MNPDSITLDYVADEAHLRETLRKHHSLRLMRVFPWLLWAASGIGLIVALLAASKPFQFSTTEFLLMALSVFCGLLGFYLTPTGLARTQRNLSPATRNQTVHWHITGTELSTQVGDQISACFAWESLYRILRLPDGFLLYTNAVHVFWLPDKLFPNAQSISQFSQWAAHKVPSYTNIHPSRWLEWGVSIILGGIMLPMVLFTYRLFANDSGMDSFGSLVWHMSLYTIPGILLNLVAGLPVYGLVYWFGCRNWACYVTAGALLGTLLAYLTPWLAAPWITSPGFANGLMVFASLAYLHWLIAVRGSQPKPQSR